MAAIQPLRSSILLANRLQQFPIGRPCSLQHSLRAKQQARTIFYLPTILSPSFWRSLVPSFLRRRSTDNSQPIRKRPWNPATYFIWMSLLIGSQAIQLIMLHQSFANFGQETEQKLAKLRSVVRRMQAGEEVDVKEELGTGQPEEERAWEDVMRELESEDAIFKKRKRELKNDSTDEKGTAKAG